jgi:hypothetical protein
VLAPAVGRIRLLRDGVEQHTRRADNLRVSAPEPGIWRVEVATETGAPWLFSGSIRVLPAATATVIHVAQKSQAMPTHILASF